MRYAWFAAAAFMAGQAHAQSSVTLFGIGDISVRHVSGEGAGGRTTVNSGANTPARLGFRGIEDLGGGWRASFWLETTVNFDTGAGMQQFDRASWIGLGNKQYGELRLGRQLLPVHSTMSIGDPFSSVGVGTPQQLSSAPGNTPTPFFSAFGTNARGSSTATYGNNVLLYATPEGLGGLSATVYYAPSEGGGAPGTALTAGSSQGIQAATIGYKRNRLSIGIGHSETSNMFTGSDRFTDQTAHILYDFGPAKVALGVRRFSRMAAVQTLTHVGVWAPVGSSGLVKGAVARRYHKGTIGSVRIDANDAWLAAIGYEHALSKRTRLYATAVMLHNSIGSASTLSNGNPVGSGAKARGVEFGMRTDF